MTATMFWLSVSAVAVVGAGLFAAGIGVGYGIARRRYARKRAARKGGTVYSVRQVEFVPAPLGKETKV